MASEATTLTAANDAEPSATVPIAANGEPAKLVLPQKYEAITTVELLSAWKNTANHSELLQ